MKFFEFIRKQLSEDNGNPSSSRTNTFIALLVFLLTYVGIAVNVCWFHPEMIAMVFEATVGLILGILGLRIVAKTTEQKTTGDGINSTPDKTEEAKQ